MSTADKIKSPFSKVYRGQLMSLSKLAKEKQWLDGYQRKILYEAGHYNYIFVSRLNLITSALDALCEHVDEAKEEQVLELKNTGYRTYLEHQASCNMPDSQYLLGDAYYYGFFGFEEDEQLAGKWMVLAADAGHADAQYTAHNWFYAGLWPRGG